MNEPHKLVGPDWEATINTSPGPGSASRNNCPYARCEQHGTVHSHPSPEAIQARIDDYAQRRPRVRLATWLRRRRPIEED